MSAAGEDYGIPEYENAENNTDYESEYAGVTADYGLSL